MTNNFLKNIGGTRDRRKAMVGSTVVHVHPTCEHLLDIKPRNISALGINYLLRGFPSSPDSSNLGIPGSSPSAEVSNRAPSNRKWLMVYVPNVDVEQVDVLQNGFDVTQSTSLRGRGNMIYAALPDLTQVSESSPEQIDGILRACGNTIDMKELVHATHVLSIMGYPSDGLRLDRIRGGSRAFALDCEMSLSGNTRVLTRISVIDYESEAVAYSTFVKPKEPITDYATEYSGVTPELLEDVTTTLQDVHDWLLDHIGSTDILIGHSLESDFSVLGITHDKCIDTVLLFPHIKGLPYRSSLRYITKKFLNREIQLAGGGTSGHHPTEDALACVHLVKLKASKGFLFGDETKRNTVPLSKFLSRNGVETAIVDHGIPYWDAHGTAHIVSVENDDDASLQTLKAIKQRSFVLCGLRGSSISSINTTLSKIIESAPDETLVTVWNGGGDLAPVEALIARRAEYRTKPEGEKSTITVNDWTQDDDQRLKNAVFEAKQGTLFVALKNKDKITGAVEYILEGLKSANSDKPKKLAIVPKKRGRRHRKKKIAEESAVEPTNSEDISDSSSD